ncbi:hypothetical protein J2X31_003660 [Flavobacterium arsenatis]|uniref:SH3b domain-containing protein n=1 Tax=Flavobacterium arsenatis TaxID=1484332 RepID=A0ABU1TUT1_9FLAO|nr:SH3 domain-containing protein [Flavobacterium arsenatis]MDR6969627.1 hypothetical protein [Flavobacterium arsenatis]
MKNLLLLTAFALIFFVQSCGQTSQQATETSKQLQTTESNVKLVSENESENLFSFSNFAKIEDKDGYVNIREEANTNSKIVGKIKSGEIVYIFNYGDELGNWLIIDYLENDENLLTGYIHKSRLKPINSYEHIPSVWHDENGAEFILRNIQIKIKTEKFDYEANKKYFSTFQYATYAVDKYKHQEIWGTDGTLPQTHYTSITANIDNQTIEIPEKEIENLFNTNNEYSECYFDKNTETLYIILMNSDGAGAYRVIFIIEKGKYKSRKIYNAN